MCAPGVATVLRQHASLWKQLCDYLDDDDADVLYVQAIRVPEGAIPAQGLHRDHALGPRRAVTVAFSDHGALNTEFVDGSHTDDEMLDRILAHTLSRRTRSRPKRAAAVEDVPVTRSDGSLVVYDMYTVHRGSARKPDDRAQERRFFACVVPRTMQAKERREVMSANV